MLPPCFPQRAIGKALNVPERGNMQLAEVRQLTRGKISSRDIFLSKRNLEVEIRIPYGLLGRLPNWLQHSARLHREEA